MNGSEREILAGKRRFLHIRSRALRRIRAFFDGEGFLEVQTPVLTSAPAPETHIRTIAADGGRYLSTSPELFMKRLLAAGYEKIYQISPAFRAGERGRLHHPEFTILEWYRSGADYRTLQDDCQRLVQSVCGALGPDCAPRRGDRALAAGGEWTRMSVREACMEFAGWDPGPDPDEDRFDTVMVEKVEPNLGFPAPCILEDYPAGRAALARLKPGDPEVAERFELYWAGIELANGFSELTDPAEQRARFEAAIYLKQTREGVRPNMPEAFLESLHNLGPCAGIAFGVDRFVMLLAGADDIDSVTAFSPEMA
ncbi:MAG: EF-P lysine aminoacylase EpmA [Syntrophobacteraceae bacterium]